ncbi:ATP-binding cassette domain-containing protein [Herbiconiux ginsengi]|uniref:ABC-type sugar transport system, ATPase component n=1 Tax=Herbiconiux ginsengi TaxID=381665 RepID=A0A1H3TUN9_9MICO|nr:ATP-binding cassette domain-containing protein [Herbiconiux ginsengi]SDZ53926.1 ABC-type sugar transport system, ATPase component [Herbiconiux ginsengi]
METKQHSGTRGAAAAPRTSLIHAAGVTKTFGGVKAVSGIDLDVHEGEVVGIMGPNGAGKSTFLSLLAGAQRPTSGELVVAGRSMRSADRAAMARLGVGLAHQIPKPFRRLTVRENVRVAAQTAPRARRRDLVEKALEMSGMAAKADNPAGELGLLEMKRLELARVLALDPKLVLLDEVAAGLNTRDLDELIALVALIRDEGRTLVIVEHVQEVFHQLAERIVVLEWGQKLTEGSPAEVAADPRVVEIYLGESSAADGPARRAPRPAGGPARLTATGLTAGYGQATVLHDVDLELHAGQVLAVLGANGAGKSTLAKSLAGMIPIRSGTVSLDGAPIDQLSSFQRVRKGLALVPEGRRLFADLTVRENLELGVGARSTHQSLDRIHELFPKLTELSGRAAGALSGGEQQMVAIGRALASEPKVIVFDELSLGLAPVVVDRLLEAVDEIAAWGTAVVLIEQNVHRALALADEALVLRQGRVVFRGDPAAFSDEALRLAYLGTDL